MNTGPNIHSTDVQHLAFIKAFQSLLDEKIEPESEEIRNTKVGCEALKYQIRDILERIKALDILNDDFSVIGICEQKVDLPLRRYVEQCKKPWLQDKLTIALMGHLKTGKTTAMNCYFGEEFPTSSEEATALATYLYDGENPNQTASLVDKEGGVQEINAEQLQLFSLENSFNFPFARMFSYIAKKSKHPALSDKTFIDTPGLFSSNSEHAYTTYKVLDYCDVVFWFIDCRKSISKTEISFIKEQIKDKPIYVIFSFVDAKGTTESGVKKSQEVIKKKLTEGDIKVQGYLQFGRKESTQEQFREKFGKTVDSIGKNYQVVDPIVEIIKILLALQKLMITAQQEATELRDNKKSELDTNVNKMTSAERSFNSARSSVINGISSLSRFINEKCATGTRWCTDSKYKGLLSNMGLLRSVLPNMEEAWENFNFQSIAQFGVLSSEIERLNDIIFRLDSINSDINSILNKFKS